MVLAIMGNFECLNMAQLWKLPIIFVVENNKWAIGMAHDRATSNPVGESRRFGMHGEEVDGMDVLAVEVPHKEQLSGQEQGKTQLF